MSNDSAGTPHLPGTEARPASGPAADSPDGASRVEAISRSVDALFASANPTPASIAAGHPFLGRIRSYLAAEGETRRTLAAEVFTEAAALEGQDDLDPLAGGIALLILGAAAEASASDSAGELPAAEPEALRMARELTTPAVAARLVLHLGAEREEAARGAWMQIASHLPEAMAPALADGLADDRDMGARRVCLEAMKALGGPGHRQALDMLEDRRWFVVRNGVHLLGDFGYEGAVAQVTSALGHSDPRVRRETVMTLAKLGGEDASLLLLGLLADPDTDVREAATMAVGVLKVQRALRPLLERLEDEESEDVLVQILRSLGQIGDPGAVPAIEKRAVGGFFSRPRSAVRIAAYRALAGIGTPHARELLERAEEDKDPEVRTAVSGILSARTPRAVATSGAGAGAGTGGAAGDEERPTGTAGRDEPGATIEDREG
jgi:hypothetical protein